jgi:hypothetical protein
MDTLKTLANLMKAKDQGSCILFLGAGASIESGGPDTDAIVDGIVRDFGDPSKSVGPGKREEFYDILENRMGRRDRQAAFRQYFESMKPSPGYIKLAELIKQGWFDIVLTTNVDNMFERAFTAQQLAPGDDYDRFIVGRDNDDDIDFFLNTADPRVKLVKLHGDLGAGILNFTPVETLRFSSPIERSLKAVTASNILFLGYSGRDKSVLGVLNREGDGIWWASLSQPNWGDPEQREILAILLHRKSDHNMVFGPDGQFEAVVDRLARLL